MLPFPMPLVPALKVIHELVLLAVQEHPMRVVTATAPVSAAPPLSTSARHENEFPHPGLIWENRFAALGETFFTSILASKTARVVGRPGLPHSWSYLPDIVSTLIAAADHDGEWGRLWHVPSAAASRIEIADQVNRRFGTHGKVAAYPQWLLRSLGMVNPMMHEIWASSYQFTVPYLIDSTETQRELGVSATVWADALATSAESYRR